MSKLLIDAAEDYLSRGLSVIALSGKAPNGVIHKHGLHDAFAMQDGRLKGPTTLVEAFSFVATTGIGILTSYPYFVVDIDGEEGALHWKQLVGSEDFMPTSWVAKTGRGLHLWYADWTPRRTRKLAPLLDLKAAGGYVAAPPSLHPEGHTYEWLLPPSDGSPMQAPYALTKLLDDAEALEKQQVITAESNRRPVHALKEGGKFWASFVSLQGPIRRMREAESGERNALLYWAAMAILRDGAQQEDLEQLHAAAVDVGLGDREARQTIRSAQKKVARG